MEQSESLISALELFACAKGLLPLCVLFCLNRWLCVSDFRACKEKRMGIWCYLFLFANSGYAFFALEYLNNPDLGKMEIPYMLLNVAGIMILSLILLFWLNSFRRTMIAILLVFTLASFVFAHVYACRGEPLQLIDVFAVGTAMEVAGEYQFELTQEGSCILLLSFLLLLLYWHLPDWKLAKTRKGKIGIRVGVFASMILGYFLYMNTNWNGNLGILTDLWAPIKTYKEYGTEVGFFCVAKYMRLTEPEGYSARAVEELASRVEKELEDNQEKDQGKGMSEETGENALSGKKILPVNVIAIMNESWADYRLMGDLDTTEPVMPFYDSMSKNTIKGHTLVCIRGGGTAKTEYEFLTGNSEKRFPGMVPYVSYYTHEQHSLFEVMQDQGYEIAAMHPNKGTNWNRSNAYRLMGVEDFYTIDDFPEDAKRIRAHISDEANYDAIIQLVEEKEEADQPFFLFDVTMQNHGGYKAKKYVSNIHLNGYEDDTVDQYLSLLRDSDDALEKLIRYFEKCPEPTMILMFGDHLPDLPDEFAEHLTGKTYDDSSLEEQELYYETPFFIWTNYEQREEEGILTSTNYLGTMMLEEAGLELPPYNQYLEMLRERIPALNHLGYLKADGQWVRWDDATDPEATLEKEYEYFQYNNLAENRKRLDWFYEVKNRN
ncbi:MAG: LTA synthase family protein [Lachnospiraceae bacterium]|nr:LTA synthase family protein [Lachnospiraceae bacterium]